MEGVSGQEAFYFTAHFKERLEKRLKELGAPLHLILETAAHPEQVLKDETDSDLVIHQSRFELDGKRYLCRVVVNFTTTPATLVSFYLTSKTDKYWKL